MNRCRRFSAAGILLAGMLFASQELAAQVVRIAEMNTRQIQALNLQKTVVLFVGKRAPPPFIHRYIPQISPKEL